MKVVFEGFSIREYTSKMRSVDVSKCWPFEKDETNREETLLPPMTCKKYRWWGNELDAVKSSGVGDEEEEDDDEEGKAKPVLEVTIPLTEKQSGFEDMVTEKAVSEDKKKLMSNVVVLKKSKILKKRSIVEIFAVAPQIVTAVEKVDDGKGKGKEEEEEADLNKPKSKGVTIKRNLKLKSKEKKKIIGSTAAAASKLISKKEKCPKPKVRVPTSSITRTKGLLFNKKLRRQITDDVAMLKKKPSSKKSLSKQNNKLNVCQTSKLVAKRQEQEPPVFPVYSILKNQTRVISTPKPSDCLRGADQTTHCLVQQSERHVSFSGKDDIIGPTKKCCPSFELPRSQCLQKVFSDVVDNALVSQLSEDSDEDFPKDETPEVNESDEDVVINIESEVGVQSTHDKELLDEENDHVSVSTSVSASNDSCQDKGKGFSDESVDLTRASQHHHDFQLFSQGKSNSLYNHPYAGIPRVINSTRLSSNVEIEAGGYQEANDRGKSLLDPFVISFPRSAATNSFENIRDAVQPSASSLTTSIEPNVRHQFLPHSSMHPSNDCALEYQPFSHLSPKGMMSSISSSVEWKKQGAVIRRNNVIDDGFIGLPLNSQGEFIQCHSSGKLGYNHLKKPDIMMGSSSTMPISNHMWPNIMDQTNMKQKHHVDSATPEDNLKLFPGKNCFTQNPIPLPSRLGVTEMQGTRRTDVHWQDSLRGNNNSIHQLGSDLHLMKLSCHECRPCSLTLNQSENGKKPADSSECGFLPPNQPTMRLMGKDVTVGRSSNQEVQGFEDGERIWTDKEIITEHYPTMCSAPVSANFPLYRHFQPEQVTHPLPPKTKGIVTPSSGAQTSTISPNFLQMRAVDSRSAHSYLDWQTYVLSQSGIPLVNRDNFQELQPFANPLDSQLWMNRTSKVMESGISAIGCSKVSSEIPEPVPVPTPSPHNSCDLRFFNSTQLKAKKSLDAQETASSFMFPFSGQDCPDYVQPSWSQSSSYCLPQWLQSAPLQQEASPTISQLYSDTSAKYQPCSVSGSGFVAIPSYHNSMISYSHYPSNSFPRVQSSSGSSSLVHPPLMPVPPGYRRTFPINTSCKKRVKVKDGTKCNNYCFNHLDHGKKARKRPAAIADDLARPLKKLNCGMHDSSSLVGFNSGAKFGVYKQYNTGTPVLDEYRNKGAGIGFSPMEIQRDGLLNSPGIVFPNVDTMGRSCPIKLSAGAKHIFKPNQNMDQVDYRLTHSAIPVGAVTNSSKVSVFQKKPAQLYRF